MGQVISLCKARRQRSGELPPLGLLGKSASADSILKTALAAVDADERLELLTILASGTYRDMLVQLTTRFNIMNSSDTRAVG